MYLYTQRRRETSIGNLSSPDSLVNSEVDRKVFSLVNEALTLKWFGENLSCVKENKENRPMFVSRTKWY